MKNSFLTDLCNIAITNNIRSSSLFSAMTAPLRREKATARREALKVLNTFKASSLPRGGAKVKAFEAALRKSELTASEELAFAEKADAGATARAVTEKRKAQAEARRKKIAEKAKAEAVAQKASERMRIALAVFTTALAKRNDPELTKMFRDLQLKEG